MHSSLFTTAATPSGRMPGHGGRRSAKVARLGIEPLEPRRLLSSYQFAYNLPFSSPTTGYYPHADSDLVGNLVVDSAGDVFGNTTGGGPAGDSLGLGTVYEVKAGADNISVVTPIDTDDQIEGLVLNSSDDLIANTFGGLIEEIPPGGSSFVPEVLGAVGELTGGLAIDSAGDVFGAEAGQSLFELPKGGSSETILGELDDGTSSGYASIGYVDQAGDLFGTTSEGGADNGGELFELVAGSQNPPDAQMGTATVLGSFDGSNGTQPADSPLVADSSGNLFGITSTGGAYGYGNVFEYSPSKGTLSALASFSLSNGNQPNSLVEDSSGNLFGTTNTGGASNDGTIFEIAAGTNTIQTIASFDGTNGDGPRGLAIGTAGNLYGCTFSGGGNGLGTVFELSPSRSLLLHTSYTSADLATGAISATKGNAPLTATATITNKLNLWLAVSTTDSGSGAAAPTANTFAADGLIAPDLKASYSTTFSAAGDRVATSLSMSAAAGVMNLLDMVLPASAWKPSDKLIDELDKIYKTTALFNAKADLVAGAAGKISAASAAHAIADYTTELFANGDAQWKLVKADLKDAGVALTAAEVDELESASEIDKLAKALVSTAQLDTQLVTGAPLDVDFFATAG